MSQPATLYGHRRPIYRRLFIVSFFLFLSFLAGLGTFRTGGAHAASLTPALNHGLDLTPEMGWSTWYAFHCNVSEQEIKSQADAMVRLGLRAAGYQYINIDDCWQGGRDSHGNVYPNPTTFPDGMKALADYVHSKGLKLGIYTDRGTATCKGYVGSQGHEVQDADTYASWGIDYIKEDNCNATLDAETQYQTMRDAIAQSGRAMALNICVWGQHSVWAWGPDTGNSWRTGSDVGGAVWSNILKNIDANARYPEVNGPGHWNDPDNLMIGKGLSTTEDQSIFSMWSIMASPLIYGSDMTTMSATTQRIVTNPEVIAVDQDPLGIQGQVVWQDSTGNLQVWAKQLQGRGNWALVLFNRGGSAANITANWSSIGLTGGVRVRDLWAHRNLGMYTTSYTSSVPAHGTVMLKVEGTPYAPPVAGTSYLSDLNAIFATAGWGTVQKNKSITGAPLTLNGVTYAKGLGTHAVSDIRYNLGGKCSAFVSDIGVDDDTENSTASVIFRVYADSTKIYDSGTMGASSATQTVNVNVSRAQTLRLIVSDNYDGINYDHGDWAGARLTCGTTRFPSP